MAQAFKVVGLEDVNLIEDDYVGGFGPTEHANNDFKFPLYQYFDGKLHLSAAVSEHMRRHMETRIRAEYATLISRKRREERQGG